jgi:hypothetical protein
LLSYVALRKTSSSPSGHSRFPKTEHFVPSQAVDVAFSAITIPIPPPRM